MGLIVKKRREKKGFPDYVNILVSVHVFLSVVCVFIFIYTNVIILNYLIFYAQIYGKSNLKKKKMCGKILLV